METVVFAAALIGILALKHRQIQEAIENFNDSFRGGPPTTPMHPSPAGDDRHLRRPLKALLRDIWD
jgi:hypothetical protein